MQNTIIKEFAGNPNVVTAAYHEGGRNGETTAWAEVYWSNYYLRDLVIWDETGAVGQAHYTQPDTGLPFGRGFIIGRDGRVVLPYFGHNPQLVVETIRSLLEFSRGDANGDGRIDISDAVTILLYLFSDSEVPHVEALDTNRDGAVDVADAIYLLQYLFG